MGNQLSGAVPSMILPVERYFNLTELSDFEFISSLGSTRFMKVAKAMHKSISSNINLTKNHQSSSTMANQENLSAIEINREGICVLKFFIINDQSLLLTPYVKQIEELASVLSEPHVLNCMPYKSTIVTDKVAVLIRQYGKDTLYDRLSTRPFLQDIEKRWIAFQLLKALEQCQKAKICHGDIKSQNILVTSWNWVFLVDFASFKPTVLPTDNPTDFSYFFDSSRRRTCYIAPERFVQSSDIRALALLPDEQFLHGFNLDHGMDIFSLGCVLVELFTDGSSPFDFSQLLAYLNRKYFPTKSLDAIKNAKVREMLVGMIQLDASKRAAAQEYLAMYRGSVFPEIFYKFGYEYFSEFVRLPRKSYDEKIEKIYDDLDYIEKSISSISGDNTAVYILFISLITSMIRSLTYCECKLKAIRSINRLAVHCKEPIILDRISPYVLVMIKDTDSRIRAEVVHCLSSIMTMVKEVPKSDVRIFVDYILPILNTVLSDPSNLVRTALAQEIASLADSAARFLEYVNLNSEEDPQVQAGSESYSTLNYQAELKTLQEIVQEMVVALLCDKENNVRRALVENGLPRLCLFFGRQKASDILVSHLITFLNDKSDWKLRASFYECVPALAAYIGWQSTVLLKPLLVQGFRDPEEHVVLKSLHCLTHLARLGLLQKPIIVELVRDVAPFLSHPNGTIRVGAVSFMASCTKVLNLADVHCKLIPLLKSYISQPLLRLDREDIILHSLNDNLPRAVWDQVKVNPLCPELINFLNEKHVAQKLGGPTRGQEFQALLMNDPAYLLSNTVALPEEPRLRQFYKRLLAAGMEEQDEAKLRRFSDILLKMRRSKASEPKLQNLASAGKNLEGLSVIFQDGSDSLSSQFVGRSSQAQNGLIDLAYCKLRRKHADLTVERGGRSVKSRMSETARRINPDWKEIFGAENSESTISDETLIDILIPMEKSTVGVDFGMEPEKSTIEPSISLADTVKDEINPTIPIEKSLAVSKVSLLPDDVNQSLELTNPSGEAIDTSLAAETAIRMAQCRQALTDLVELKREDWRRSAKVFGTKSTSHSFSSGWFLGESYDSDYANSGGQKLPIFWRPSGTLLAHLHEHRQAVRRISVHPNGCHFTTCSSDGTVKVWDSSKLEGRNMINKSRYTYNRADGEILDVCTLNDSFVCCSTNGSIDVVKISGKVDSKEPSQYHVRTDMENSGHVLELKAFDEGNHVHIICLTHHGHLVAYDTRSVEPIWQVANPSQAGMATCFSIDQRNDSKHWAAIGTDSGRLVLWDLRFRLPVSTHVHPAEKPFHRIWCHPTMDSRILASIKQTGELIEWDLESGMRQFVLWTQNQPPLSYASGQEESGDQYLTKSTLTALLPYPNVDDSSALILISGDNCGNLNRWNLSDFNESHSISNAIGQIDENRPNYRTQLIDGVQVYFKERSTESVNMENRSTVYNNNISTRLNQLPTVTTQHHDGISDLGVCKNSSDQPVLISASKDGTVKLWK